MPWTPIILKIACVFWVIGGSLDEIVLLVIHSVDAYPFINFPYICMGK